MPYIEGKNRPPIDKSIKPLITEMKDLTQEELDEVVGELVTYYLMEIYPLGYFHLNRAIGIVEAVKLEYRRRSVNQVGDGFVNMWYPTADFQRRVDEIKGLAKPSANYIKSLPIKSQDGSLNYTLTRILKELYFQRNLNKYRVDRLLEDRKNRFYEDIVAPYEDIKIRDNGDV